MAVRRALGVLLLLSLLPAADCRLNQPEDCAVLPCGCTKTAAGGLNRTLLEPERTLVIVMKQQQNPRVAAALPCCTWLFLICRGSSFVPYWAARDWWWWWWCGGCITISSVLLVLYKVARWLLQFLR